MFNFRTPWRAVAAMFVLNGALFGIWASRIPAVSQPHNLSHGVLGLLLLVMAAGAIVSFPFSGAASDRFGAARVTKIIAVIYVAALFLIAFSSSLFMLVAALFLFGATHGGMDVSMNTWAAEVERESPHPIMSSFHAMFSLGAGVGAASGYFAVTNSWTPMIHFVVAGTLIALITFWIAHLPWHPTIRKNGHENTPLFQLPKGILLLVGLVAFCSSLGEGAMADWSAVFLLSIGGVTEAQAALGYTVFSIAMVGMRFLGDRVVVRFGPTNTARVAGFTSACGAATAVIFGAFYPALIGFVLMGIGYAVIVPLALTRAANDPDVSPGAAIASVSTLGYGGLLLGPPIIGLTAELTSIRMAFAILALLALTIVLLAKVLTRK